MEYFLIALFASGGGVVGGFLAGLLANDMRSLGRAPAEPASDEKPARRPPSYNTQAKAAAYLRSEQESRDVPSTWIRP